MPARPYPDDREEEANQLTLQAFIRGSRVLFQRWQRRGLSDEELLRRSKLYCQFVLAGRVSQDGVPGHVTVNACQGLGQPQRFKITRDYDSLIGITNDLPYSVHLSLNPVPPFRDALTRSNHMKATAYDRPVSVSMCNIPNFAFGRVATRSTVRVFLPRMHRNEQRMVPQEDLKLIYDECLRPLVLELMSNMGAHWPARYDAAMTLYKDKSGKIHPGSLDVPAHLLDVFGRRYLRRLRRLRPYFRDAYFVHELRGWKGATVHDPSDEGDQEGGLDDLLRFMDMERIDQDEWHVDAAIELGAPGHVVTWRTSGHRTVLAQCLPSLDDEQLDRLLSRSYFHVDNMMHLRDFSGFHCGPGPHGRLDDVNYIQAYTTEKTMAYQLHDGIFKERDPRCFLTNEGLGRLVNDILKMGDVLKGCVGEGEGQPQDGCARLEIRVPLSKALQVLQGEPQGILEECLAAVPARDWWLFKWYRLTTLYAFFVKIRDHQNMDWKSECSVALGGVAVWLLNGLYHRPGGQPLKLAEEACQRVPVDFGNYDELIDGEDAAATVPVMYDTGLYFVCDVALDENGTFRLPYHKAFSQEAMMNAFRISANQIRDIVGTANLPHVRKKRGNHQRNGNRTTQPTLVVDDVRDGQRVLPELADPLDDIDIRPLHRMRGDDVRHFQRNGGGSRNAPGRLGLERIEQNVTVVVQKILEQFFCDVIEESPNKRSVEDGAWTNIPKVLRHQEATERLFQSTALPFFSVQYCHCTHRQWNCHLSRLFPLEPPVSYRQNYGRCTYLSDWLRLIASVDQNSVPRIRDAVYSKLNSLFWLPFTQTDRMWCTRVASSSGFRGLPDPHRPCGPQIALNPVLRFGRVGRPRIRPPPPDPEEENDQLEQEGLSSRQGSERDLEEEMQDLSLSDQSDGELA